MQYFIIENGAQAGPFTPEELVNTKLITAETLVWTDGCSSTDVTFDGEQHKVSYGILGHVFTLNADDVVRSYEAVNQNGQKNSSMDNTDQKSVNDSEDVENSIDKTISKDADKLVDKVSKKVEDKINEELNKKLDEIIKALGL